MRSVRQDAAFDPKPTLTTRATVLVIDEPALPDEEAVALDG
jgi:hypothetical protein